MKTQDTSVLARSGVLGVAGLTVALLLLAIVTSFAIPDPPSMDDYLVASAWVITAVIYGCPCPVENNHFNRPAIRAVINKIHLRAP